MKARVKLTVEIDYEVELNKWDVAAKLGSGDVSKIVCKEVQEDLGISDISRAGLGLIPGKPHLGSSFRILRTGMKVLRTEIPVTYKRNE
jgi:hypothetical protein